MEEGLVVAAAGPATTTTPSAGSLATGTPAAAAGSSSGQEQQSASDAVSGTGTGWRRLTKQEKKSLRAQQQIEKKHAWRERSKEARKAASHKRQEAHRARLEAMSAAERAEFEDKDKARRDQLYRERVEQTARIDAALAGGLRVVLDLSYGERMSSREQTSLSRQLARCWGLNRRAVAPVGLHLAGLATCPPTCLPRGGSDVEHWKVHRLQEDVVTAFKADELVYLSPDADDVLTELDTSKAYVIGGLVDSSVQKHTSLGKAQLTGVRAMRLPLAEHAPVVHGRIPLTLTAVLDILLAVHAGSDWPTAIQQAVAPRLLRAGTFDNGRNARREQSRRAFAATWEAGSGGYGEECGGEDGEEEDWEEGEEEGEEGGAEDGEGEREDNAA